MGWGGGGGGALDWEKFTTFWNPWGPRDHPEKLKTCRGLGYSLSISWSMMGKGCLLEMQVLVISNAPCQTDRIRIFGARAPESAF